MPLKNKHIVVGLTGGIAAYKTLLLIRLLRKAGAQVRVVVTPNALHFVTALTLQTLSGNKVYEDMFSTTNEHETEHISLVEWADAMVVAPTTANTLCKLAYGIADNALTTTVLAFSKPLLVAPAMNEAMWKNDTVQEAIKHLSGKKNITILPTACGSLACGSEGEGRMVEPQDILFAISKALECKTLAGKRVLITAGATQEKIDPVRYISNYSSGKMGYALAQVCEWKGASVTLVSGHTHLRLSELSQTRVVSVDTAQKMYEAVDAVFAQQDACIFAAAVADFRPSHAHAQKIKEHGAAQLELVDNVDIAFEMGKRKTSQRLIGFALETDHEEQHAQEKMQRKKFDYIVLNSLQNAHTCFESDTNAVVIYSQAGAQKKVELMPKEAVAREIIEYTLEI